MADETTAAVERAAAAAITRTMTGHPWPPAMHLALAEAAGDATQGYDAIRVILAAALDVEEMADTLARVRFEQMRESFQMVGIEWADAPQFMRDQYLALARPFATALHAALLGGAS